MVVHQIYKTLMAGMLIATAVPATAEGGNAAEAKTEQQQRQRPATKKKQLICKLAETTGTRMLQKICLTADEWKQEEEKSN